MKVKRDNCNITVINGHACHEQGCYGIKKFIRRGKTYNHALVYSLDVWGNVKDGFEVNDRSLRERLYIKENASNDDIIRDLKKAGLINSKCHFKSFRTGGDEKMIFVDWNKTGEPLYQLEIE